MPDYKENPQYERLLSFLESSGASKKESALALENLSGEDLETALEKIGEFPILDEKDCEYLKWVREAYGISYVVAHAIVYDSDKNFKDYEQRQWDAYCYVHREAFSSVEEMGRCEFNSNKLRFR